MISFQQVVDILKPVLDKWGIERIIVFGSYARGSANDSSDIDLVIDSNGKLRGLEIYAAIHEITEVLPIKSDVYELSEIVKGSTFDNEIRKDGVVIYDTRLI